MSKVSAIPQLLTKKQMNIDLRIICCLLFFFILSLDIQSKEYRFLSESDIQSSTYNAKIDYRGNPFETAVKYQFFSGKAFYKKGISIPLRESVTIKVDANWNFISFVLGVDQFLFPEVKVDCQLRILSGSKLIYLSPKLTEKSPPVKVSLSLFGVKSLKFELVENNKFVFDSPDNWADLNYLGVDLTNFAWSKSKNVITPKNNVENTVVDNVGLEITRIPLPSSTWIIKYLSDCGRGYNDMILAGCFDNYLYALTPDGEKLWNTKLEGIPHEINSILDGDDLKIGILSWSLNTDLTIINATGAIIKTIEGNSRIETMTSYLNSFYTLDINNVLTQYSTIGSLINSVKVPKLRGRPMVVKFFYIPEIKDYRIFIGTTNTLACYDKNVNFLWEKSINPYNLFLSSTHDIILAKTLGKTSFIIGSRPGSVSMLDYNGNLVWCNRYSGRGHSAPEISQGDFTDTNKMEIVSVSPSGIFQLLNMKGQRIKRWEKQLPFVDIDYVSQRGEGKKNSIVAASMGPRDKNIYLLKFNKKSSDLGFKFVPSFRNDYVLPSLLKANKEIDSCKFYTKNSKNKYVSFLFDPFGGNFTNPSAFYNKNCLSEIYIRLNKIKKFTFEYSKNNVQFLPMFDLWSVVYHKERSEILDSALIMKVLSEVDKIKLPFTLLAMHGKRTIPIDILEKLVKQNKNTLIALQFSEAEGMVAYKKAVLRLAKDNGIKILFGIHQDYWLDITQRKEEFDILFNKEYNGVIVPIVKSNPSSFDLNLMSVMGMWDKGTITDWGVASQHWSWNWYTRNIDDIYPLDLLLKHDFQAASLGASWFLPEGDFMQGDTLIETFYKGRHPFYELLKKGVFSIDSIQQNQRISPIQITYKRADNYNFIKENRPGCFFTTGLQDGLLQPTAVGSFSKEISGVDRYLDVLFPRMPYGYVFISSDVLSPEKANGWSTDGKSLYKNGQRQLNTIPLTNELRKLTLDFPIQSEDAFLSVQKIGARYFIYVTAIGNLHPVEEIVTLIFRSNLEKGNTPIVLEDILKNRKIIVNNSTLKLKLLPGEVKVLLLDSY